MKKNLTLFLAIIFFNSTSYAITQEEFSEQFKPYRACFILYDINESNIVAEYDPHDRCNERLAPDSTFKIPLALMAFNQGILTQSTVLKWNGKPNALPEHNQDQTPQTWMKYSVVWFSQQLTPQIGYTRIRHYLAGFDYGNQDFRGDPEKDNGLQYAWLSSSLTISAIEQLNFLIAMLSHELPVSDAALQNTKMIMYQGKLENGADYYAKTGSGRHGRNERLSNPSKLRDGWFVGFIEDGHQQYIFVSNLTDKTTPNPTDKLPGSLLLKPIALKLLNQYFKEIKTVGDSNPSMTTLNNDQ